jgi:2-keto-4-pentenoate hydratase
VTAPFDAALAAKILIEARQTKSKIADLPPGARPRTIEEAYAIQDHIAAATGPVGGWKVSFERDGTTRVAPVAAEYVFKGGAGLSVPGPLRAEVEFAVKLIADLPAAAAPFEHATVDRAIGPAFVIFEVLGTRFADQKAVSPWAFLADSNGNAAILTGGEITGWRELDLAALDVRLQIEGIERGRSSSGAPFPRVLDMLVALANHAAAHTGGLKAGQVIITGARVGPVAIEPGSRAVGSINGQAEVVLKVD